MAPNPAVLVIGGSAGAFQVLRTVLPQLQLDVPIVVALHIAAGRNGVLRELFERECRMPVLDLFDKAPMEARSIYFAPSDYHLLLEANGTFALSVGPRVHFSRPSIDVLFESAADAFGARVIALVLSGANEDGARGAKRIRERGGTVVVQAPACCEATAMPLAAIAQAQPQHVSAVEGLGELLADLCRETGASRGRSVGANGGRK